MDLNDFLRKDKVVYTAKEIAEMFTLNYSYVRLLIARGTIGSKKVGRRCLVPRDELLLWWESLPSRKREE